MIVYYAHCMAIYNSPQEDRDVETLEDLGFKVLNPNSPFINNIVNVVREKFTPESYSYLYKDASEAIMEEVFKPLATGSDALAFRSLPDGTIPAGVAKEIAWAKEAGKPILELPTAMTRRTLSLEATREYLREIGQR